MKEAADRNGKVLMAMRNNRFIPASIYAKKAIANGEFGHFYAGRCGWIRRRGVPGDGSWFSDKSKSGGGPLIDLGVHMIDLAIYLMGNPKPVSVSGSTFQGIVDPAKKEFVFDVEDLAMGFIKFDNGACLQLGIGGIPNAVADSLMDKKDLGSHMMFIGEVTESKVLDKADSCTYAHYHKAIKPKF